MIKRNFFCELIGMYLYKTAAGKYFYAWSSKHAKKKYPNTRIYYVSEIGKSIPIRRQ